MPKYLPSATYRLQFNNQFTFGDLKKQLSYLQKLGIGCIYASPVFAAVPGSNHGYDITDSHRLNPEIGTLQEFQEIQATIHKYHIGWLQDIVPNHMAYHPNNLRLMDVLKKGRASEFAGYFDIDWDHPGFIDKLMVPILGKTFEECNVAHEIQLTHSNDRFELKYYDYILPLNASSLKTLTEKNSLPGKICKQINEDTDSLAALHDMQYYRLTHWHEVEKQLNYRRFFTINGLISLSMEKEDVFEEYHRFIVACIQNDFFQGLRIDHIDGLKRPAAYFEKLRSTVGEQVYIVAEKILQEQEKMKSTWPIEGSSGYDFLAHVNNLFFNTGSLSAIRGLWNYISGNKEDAGTFIYGMKKKILEENFRGDVDNLYRMIQENRMQKDFEYEPEERIKEALGAFLACCPVYKLYSDQLPVSHEDAIVIHYIIRKATTRNPGASKALKSLGKIFLTKTFAQNDAVTGFFLRLMQYAGPLMAKGVEDTAMYAWAEFITHNEVGDSIKAKGLSIKEFHQIMTDRRRTSPESMNATASHDTKRGEDTRARLNVISDKFVEWEMFVKQCMAQNQTFKEEVNNTWVPDAREAYFIYQMIAGVYPMKGDADAALKKRIAAYIIKSLREAKIHSNWNEPDTAYENVVNNFVSGLLTPRSSFLKGFKTYFNQIKPYGIVNSLSQVVLKCTCPGIPDFYQGSEMWDLSLVDPDNRRPVDYKLRMEALWKLHRIRDAYPEKAMEILFKSREDGRLKLWMSHCLMQERFSDGERWIYADYQPLEVTGIHKDHILAFCRRYENYWALVVIPIHTAVIGRSNGVVNWKNTAVILPEHAPSEWKSLWDEAQLKGSGSIPISKIMKLNIPMVYKAEKKPADRGCGILLHLTSLPGKLGSGSMGKGAYDFVDFLHKGRHSYWQILPFGPVESSYSPYSSQSAFAGNPILIDVFVLKDQFSLAGHFPEIQETQTAQFQLAEKISRMTLQEAYASFRKSDRLFHIRDRFRMYAEENAYWLNDYALFMTLKNKNRKQSWNRWPEAYKNRNEKALLQFQKENGEELEQLKFTQYLFHEQFRMLRSYANRMGIKIIGDVPIYVGYDSADVWSHPQLFRLDKKGNMISVAGVPPDYFSQTGQRWNMPIYDWEVMKRDEFTWWKNRIRKNLEYCDMLRFDHFRGFSAFWEVKASDRTAIKGKWTKGPGKDLFDVLLREFPSMPFIAEDLGEIDDAVYTLRDAYKLPGMRVLQFAFNNIVSESVHIPFNHTPNSIVYSGTHDNNTIRGWFRENCSPQFRRNLNRYAGIRISEKNVVSIVLQMAYASVARIALVPMQDILELNESARFNIPSRPKGNWIWKIMSADLNPDTIQKLRNLATIYGRI